MLLLARNSLFYYYLVISILHTPTPYVLHVLCYHRHGCRVPA